MDRLSGETVKAMRTSEVRDLLGKQGFDVVGSTPDEFAEWIRGPSASRTSSNFAFLE